MLIKCIIMNESLSQTIVYDLESELINKSLSLLLIV